MLINTLEIQCGSTNLAYALDEQTGTLRIWVGYYMTNAPIDAKRITIAPDNTTFVMVDNKD